MLYNSLIMRTPDNSSKTDLERLDTEIEVIQKRIASNLEKVGEVLEKYEFFKEKRSKIVNLLGSNKIGEIYEEIRTLYEGIDFVKIDVLDKKSLSSYAANFIQNIHVNNIAWDFREKLEEYEKADSEIKKNALKDSVKSIRDEFKDQKDTRHKNNIIVELENMAKRGGGTGPGPGGGSFSGGGNPRMSVDDLIRLKKAESDIRKKEAEHAASLGKTPDDPTKKLKEEIERLVEDQSKGYTLSASEENLLNDPANKRLVEKARDIVESSKSTETIRREIAEAEMQGKTLTSAQKRFLTKSGERTEIDTLITQTENNLREETRIAKKIAEEGKRKLTTSEKDFYKIHKDNIDDQITDFEEEHTESVNNIIDKLAAKIAKQEPINAAEKMQIKKYQTEIDALIPEKIQKIERDKKTRIDIAFAEKRGTSLTPEQMTFALLPTERNNINTLTTEIETISDLLSQDSSVLSIDQKKFYEDNQSSFDPIVAEKKEARLNQAKDDLVDKILRNDPRDPLTAEEQALEKAHRADIDKKLVKKLQDEIALEERKTSPDVPDRHKINDLQGRIRERLTRSVHAKENYKPYAEELRSTIDQINEIKKNPNLSETDNARLALLEAEKEQIYTKLDNLGPSGRHFAELEIARADLAKTNLDFQQSFKSKYFGAKIVGVFAGMFGSKWSAVKETEQTPELKKKMDAARHSYDEVRRTLMNTLVDEEHSVRKAFGQDFTKLSADQKNSLESWLSNLNWEYVKEEREKLDDMKHAFETTIKGNAMRKFGNWYSKDFMNFGPLKDNVRARNIAKRLVSAGILSAALLPFTGAGALGYFSYRMTRAAISGTVGESAAALVARMHGGKMNKKGEFTNHLEKKEAELREVDAKFVSEMMRRFEKEEKPQITSGIMTNLTKEHEAAVNNYMRRQGNTRRAEMWARILAGGGSAYAISQLGILPNPMITPTPTPEPGPVIPPTPTPEQIHLEGDFVPASSNGAIQTFMDLKEKMIAHHSSQFPGLTHDQIVEKMTATGHFDKLTLDIMNAKSLKDFMQVAEEHGFWKPEGWHNANIDSATVPKGSIVGMETDPAGNMRLYITLPDNTKIPLDDNFQEALDKHIKGVGIIDTDRLGNRAPNNGGFGPVRPAFDNGDLEPGEYGPVYQDNSPNLENNSPSNPVLFDPAVEQYQAGGDLSAYRDGLEAEYQRLWNRYHGDFFKTNKMDLTSPSAIYRSMIASGHDVKVYGDGFTPAQIPDLEKIRTGHATSFIIDGQEYYLSSYENAPVDGKILERDLVLGVDANGKFITMQDYHNYQKLDHFQMVDQPYEEYVRERLEDVIETGKPDPEIGVTQVMIDNAKEEADSWVDDAFSKKNFWGKTIEGSDTREWRKLSDDSAYDFWNENKPPHGRSISDKEKFFDIIADVAKKYNAYPVQGETVQGYIERLALIDEIEKQNMVQASR